MRHRINGCRLNLRDLTDSELAELIDGTQTRIDTATGELELLSLESVRRREGTDFVELATVLPLPRREGRIAAPFDVITGHPV